MGLGMGWVTDSLDLVAALEVTRVARADGDIAGDEVLVVARVVLALFERVLASCRLMEKITEN